MFNEKVVLNLPKSLDKHKITLVFPSRTLIGRADEVLPYLYSIEKGFIKVYSVSGSGKKTAHMFYGPGDYFSIPQLVYDIPMGLYYETIQETITTAYPKEHVQKAMHEEAEFAFSIVKFAVDQAVQFKYQIDNISLKFASEKIAFRLLLLISRYGIQKAGIFSLPVFAQEDFASTISLSRESVSKGLKRLERLGAISYKGGSMCISDIAALLKDLGGVDKLPPNLLHPPELTVNR